MAPEFPSTHDILLSNYTGRLPPMQDMAVPTCAYRSR